jgi:large subunit ribosomal protein L4
MQVEIYSIDSDKKSGMEVSEIIFNKPFNDSLIHQVITACLANRRQGTHQQKTRAEVSGGGIKPFRQKGSGRARAGTIRSPLWRHGGVTFAARPGVYTQKINKKMYRGAMSSILSQLLRDNRLIVIDKFELEQAKTKLLVSLLKKLNATKPLIIVDEIEEKTMLASRNLINTLLITVNTVDPVNLLQHQNVIITKAALEKLSEVLNHG